MKTKIIPLSILMLLILPGLVSPAVAFENSQLQWTTGISGKLQRNQALSYMGYSVKAVVFPPPVESDRYKEVPVESVATYVGLEISKKGVFQETVMLGPFESYIVPDGEIKITVKELPLGSAAEWLFESYSPWVVVEIESRGRPGLEISITADKDEYSPHSEIPVTVTLNNKGDADAVNVDMDIQAGLPILRGNLKYNYERIGKGASITETITFTAPAHEGRETYNIAANVSSYDVKGTQYSAKSTKSISVSVISVECLSFRKSTVQKMYLKDLAVVSLSVKNSGTCDLKNVTITDSVPANIKLLGNHSLKWLTDFPPSAEWDYTYLIKPEEPNKDGLVLPPASATYRLRGEVYNIQSNQPKIIVYGPKIVLSKQADVSSVLKGDTVKVTVTAQNTGSTPTKVTIFDNISGETTLLGDVKAYGNSNEANEKISFGYAYRDSKCTESVKGISAYETFIEAAKSYIQWVPECAESVNGIAAYEDFLEANTKISFSYNLKVNSNESFKMPAASAQYFELGNIGEKIYTHAPGPDITIIHPEDKIVEDTPTETPTPLPTETQEPSRSEAQEIITNRSAGEIIMRNDTFFLSYLWNRSDITFLNKSVRGTGEGSGIRKELNYSLDFSNATQGNNTFARFFNYVKNTFSGWRNETGFNQSENVSYDTALPVTNETSGNETQGNNTITRFFNYIKNAISGRENETGLNESGNVSYDAALPVTNETSGNETQGNNTITRFFNYIKNAFSKGENETGLNESGNVSYDAALPVTNETAGNETQGNNTITRFFNYIKNAFSGGENETGLNESGNVSYDTALPVTNETSGNATEGNNTITRFFNYIKNTLSVWSNESGPNQSENGLSNVSLPVTNETSGNATNVTSNDNRNNINRILYITLLLTSSLVLYLLIKLRKESIDKQV